MVVGLSHTGLTTKDMDKSIWFYTNIFDGKLILNVEEPKGTPWIKLIRFRDGSMLELFYPREQFPLSDKQGRNHIAFRVDDIESMREKLLKNNIEGITDIILARDGNKQMWCVDPNGYRVEIMEYQEGCPQLGNGEVVTLY